MVLFRNCALWLMRISRGRADLVHRDSLPFEIGPAAGVEIAVKAEC